MSSPSLSRGLLAAQLLVLTACTANPSAPASSVPKVTWGDEPPAAGAPATPVAREVTLAHLTACPTSSAPRSGGLPDLTLGCFGGGRTVNLAGLPQGKPTVITVWAQWCGPCETETPYLVRAHDHLGDKVNFIGIDFTDDPDKALAFAQQYGIDWPQLVDPKGASRGPLRIPGIPTTILVDAQGRVVARHAQPFTSPDEVEKLIMDELGVQA